MNKSVKAPGYFVTLAASVLAVVAAVCYGILFKDIAYKEPVFDIMICVIVAGAGVIGLVLSVLGEKTVGFAPAVLSLGTGVGFLMFAKMVIWPVADTIYGIEPFPQFTQLVICAVALILSFIVSEVALYMKKYKAVQG